MTIRGRNISFSPESINEHLRITTTDSMPSMTDWNQVASTLTNGSVSVWKGYTIESKYPTTLYALLHGICIRNQIPIAHRSTISKPLVELIYHVGQGKHVNLGQLIFDQLASHAPSKLSPHPISHPSTIFEMVLQQAPDIIGESVTMTAPKPLMVEHFIDVFIPESIKHVFI